MIRLPSLTRTVRLLQKLPGVGEKTATRFAIHLLTEEPEFARGLARALAALHDSIATCPECLGLAERPEHGASDLCSICDDESRRSDFLCVVARMQDIFALERGNSIPGRYFVLGKLLAPLDGVGVDDLPIGQLRQKIERDSVKELLLATPASVDGEATALLLRRELSDLPVSISRLASGIPHGGDIELLDPVTLSRAVLGRQRYE